MTSSSPSSEELKSREASSAAAHAFSSSATIVTLTSRLLGVELLAERLEVGDVGLVVMGDVRDRLPSCARGSRPMICWIRVSGDALDLAVLREVDLRPGRQVERRRAVGAAAAPRGVLR